MAQSLSQEILTYRARNDISQAEMAKRCKLTKQTIYMIENGRQSPGKLTEMKIRLVLDGWQELVQDGKES